LTFNLESCFRIVPAAKTKTTRRSKLHPTSQPQPLRFANSMSLWQRISTDASHAAEDVYSHWVLGDDTGKSVLVPFVYYPESGLEAATATATATADSLGLVFVEINGRAYVKSVVPGSAADRAGIAPHDAVQLAVTARPPSSRQLHQRAQRDTMGRVHGHSPTTAARNSNSSSSSSSNQYSDEPILGNEEDDVRRATAYAFHLEKQGARTSYDQLHYLLSRVWRHDLTQVAAHFGSPCVDNSISNSPVSSSPTASPTMDHSPHHRSTPASRRRQRYQTRMKSWNRPSIPPLSCWNLLHTSSDKKSDDDTFRDLDTLPSSSSESSGDGYDNGHPHGVSSLVSRRPTVLLFRRTRQRQSGGAAASSESLCLLPTALFRLDDECDAACRLVQRLAPTADMAAPVPDTWEELVHDGTDWLLGPSSMLPPKSSQQLSSTTTTTTSLPVMSTSHPDAPFPSQSVRSSMANDAAGTDHPSPTSPLSSPHAIPLDDFERVRVQKLAALRARMTAETLGVDRTDDVEAATVRAMIQKAVGLAFVRASKVVLGVSMHGGSGIVLARLSDGTWSAPSAIGMWGLGFGIQFGLEVAEYIFILQTPEAMQHFRRGGSYTVGGNMGVAVGGLGREAYGAASVGGGNLCGNDTTTPSRGEEDDYNDQNEYDSQQDGGAKGSREAESSLGVAPIVAYAKSQGLYVGVSLEGSRIFTRNDINCRTYKFATGRNVTAHDILSGKVPTPPEAEELYAALHSVEFTHEMSCLPRPPEVLRKVSANAWTFDRTIQLNPGASAHSPSSPASPHHPFDFFAILSQREAEECDAFEAQFKNFMYGGVSVQRLLTDTEGHADRTGKERRTLWLMLPEIGSLRLGFVSKLSDGEGAVSNKSSTLRARRDDPSRMSVAGVEADVGTVGSEDLTLDSALYTRVRLLDRLGACTLVF
jgi:lipid-binding SYLF domain-containing protein